MTDDLYALSEQQRLHVPGRRTDAVFPMPAGVTAGEVTAALRDLVRRTEILRTAFVAVPGWPSGMQRPLPAAQAPAVEVVELRGVADPGAAAAARARTLELDPASGRVIGAVLATGHGSAALAVTGLTVAVDRRSLELIAAVARGAADSVTDVRYLSYGAWQAQQADTTEAKEWHARLDELHLQERLQAEAPLTHHVRRHGGTPGRVPVPLTTATPESDAVLIAAWGQFCAELAGHRVAVVGVLRDGRDDDQLTTVVGPFARLMPVPLDLDGSDLVDQVRAGLAEADAHLHHHDASAYRDAHFPFAYLGADRCGERFDLALARDADGTLVVWHDQDRIAVSHAAVVAQRFAEFLAGEPDTATDDAGPARRRERPDLGRVVAVWAADADRVALDRDDGPVLFAELDTTPAGLLATLGSDTDPAELADGAARTVRALGLRPDDVLLTAWPRGSAGWVRDVTAAWLVGACLVEAASVRADRTALARRIAGSRATVVDLLPDQWRAVHTAALEDADLRGQLTTGRLRLLVASGQLLHARTAEAMRDLAGPAAEVRTLYTAAGIAGALAAHRVGAAELERDIVPVGRPVDGVGWRVAGDGGVTLPPGVAGRFLVRVAGREHDTGETAVLDETGAALGQGRDHPVFVHGFRVDPELAEAALDRHPAIAQSLVWSPGAGSGPELVAFLVVERDQRPTRVDIVSFLRDRVPGYLIPAQFRVVTALPRTHEGLVDHTRTATLAGQGWAVT
ncbi:AMP-binding enzyme [Actinophytocola sp. KF-1]